MFDPGIAVVPTEKPMGFRYGPDCFGPVPEIRRLDAIRGSLLDPGCNGPEEVYAIAMDVGKTAHRRELERRMLLFGVVTYARGRLGREPVRSQGHVHGISSHCGWRTPEVYEIWRGKAVVYMQERAGDDPGRCFAVEAGPGDVVAVPPGWAHAAISADPSVPLTFGAWCDRQYCFDYEGVRAHRGMAFYALLDEQGSLMWRENPHYGHAVLERKKPRVYAELGIRPGVPVYTQFEQDFERFRFVSDPACRLEAWSAFAP